jgi:hypothetical protein
MTIAAQMKAKSAKLTTLMNMMHEFAKDDR